jgi:hypothetical protein
MGNDEILLKMQSNQRQRHASHSTGRIYLDVHQIVDTDAPQLRKLLPALLQKRGNIVSFLTLSHKAAQACTGRVSHTCCKRRCEG